MEPVCKTNFQLQEYFGINSALHQIIRNTYEVTTFLLGFQQCFMSKFTQRNYWLMKSSDSRLCILSSNSKPQNAKSSYSVDAQAVDIYMT